MRGKKGYSLVIVLFVSTIILMLGTAIVNMSTSEYMMGSYVRDYTMAYYLAEGGVQKALLLLKENPEYRANTNWQGLGEGHYKIIISSKQGTDSIVINSSGRVNKAEVSISVTADLHIEIDEEEYPDPPHLNVEIQILSWDYKGPI
jgi:Tfp pilus assembly protein PilX